MVTTRFVKGFRVVTVKEMGQSILGGYNSICKGVLGGYGQGNGSVYFNMINLSYHNFRILRLVCTRSDSYV